MSRILKFVTLPSVLFCLLSGGSSAPAARPAKMSITLIGGQKSHGPGEHDFPNGIRRLQQMLEQSPDIRSLSGVRVEAFPDGWPDEDVLERSATILWYFDGVGKHPLLDARYRATFARLMQRGVGLVALHQASTIPSQDVSIDLPNWLGAARYGMFNRTTERVEFTPLQHEITRGVQSFSYRDEFYPTLRFAQDAGRVIPLLRPQLHVQFEAGKTIQDAPGEVYTVAWALERKGGGRSFGFTGLHYLSALEEPDVRKLILNAIVWTAGWHVPRAGVRSVQP